MLEIKCFECNALQENCYVVSDETGECVVIDCGAYYREEKDALASYFRSHRLKPVHLPTTTLAMSSSMPIISYRLRCATRMPH